MSCSLFDRLFWISKWLASSRKLVSTESCLLHVEVVTVTVALVTKLDSLINYPKRTKLIKQASQYSSCQKQMKERNLLSGSTAFSSACTWRIMWCWFLFAYLFAYLFAASFFVMSNCQVFFFTPGDKGAKIHRSMCKYLWYGRHVHRHKTDQLVVI